jgi:hypothetical protein
MVNVRSCNQTWNGKEAVHKRVSDTLAIPMKRDLDAMLVKYGMAECKPETTPAVPNSKLII